MASSFELGDCQPAPPSLPASPVSAGDSFTALFGPPVVVARPTNQSVGKGRLVGEQQLMEKRSRKPLPVNPLTGEVLGAGNLEVQVVEVKRSGKVATRRPPGDFHSELW